MKKLISTLAFMLITLTCVMGQEAPKVIKLNTPTFNEGMKLMRH